MNSRMVKMEAPIQRPRVPPMVPSRLAKPWTIRYINLCALHNSTHRGMLDSLDEVEGGIVDLEGNHVSLPSSYIGKTSSQLLKPV